MASLESAIFGVRLMPTRNIRPLNPPNRRCLHDFEFQDQAFGISLVFRPSSFSQMTNFIQIFKTELLKLHCFFLPMKLHLEGYFSRKLSYLHRQISTEYRTFEIFIFMIQRLEFRCFILNINS